MSLKTFVLLIFDFLFFLTSKRFEKKKKKKRFHKGEFIYFLSGISFLVNASLAERIQTNILINPKAPDALA